MRICEGGTMTTLTEITIYAKGYRRQKTGRVAMGWLLHNLAGLLLIAMLGAAVWLTPQTAEAATDTYYFQNVASTSVCGGTSTINQSGEANVLPGGPLISSYGGQLIRSTFHFSWNAGGLDATSLADDMYIVPYSVPMTITALSLKLNHDVTYGNILNTWFYAKFYDVDGNAVCPAFERGTLIGQTVQKNLTGTGTTAILSGLTYNMLPGHRIRVELWYSTNFTRIATTFKYGFGTDTGLTVTHAPTLTDTVTVGAGSDLPDAALAPGGPETALNAFTLQTSTGTDSIKAVRINMSQPGASSGIASISVKSDNGSITYGTVTNPTMELLAIPLSTLITATTTPVQYKIMVTPKTQAAMPPPPGGSYAVQGYVYQLDSAYAKVYNDTTSATVTIDNLSPTTPVVTASPGDSTVVFNWTNPADADFQSVLILRGTYAFTATPVEGSSYTVGGVLGAGKVVYVGNLQTFTDGLVPGDVLWNGTPYYYLIFFRDSNGNYSPVWSSGPITPVQSGPGTVVVGDGINPANRTIGLSSADLDVFTVTSWPPSHLKSVSFTLSPGISAYNPGISLYDSNDVSLKSVMATSDTVVLSNLNNPNTGLSIPITNIASSFKIRVGWNTNMPPPVGSHTDITGRVTAITLDNANMNITYNDTGSATVTIDYEAPANAVLQSVTPSDSSVALGWQNPAALDTTGTLILRNTVPVADAPRSPFGYSPGDTIGTSKVVSRLISAPSSSQVFTDSNSGLVNGTAYYYKLFSYDQGTNYSTGLSVGPVTPDVVVTVGNGTDPANTVIAPGSGAAALDAFTVKSTSSASISSVTVTLSSGAQDVVGSVRITSGDGVTVYGTVANPASETVTIPTTGLAATATAANCRIDIIPKTHTEMPLVPGAEVAVTGRVTAVTTVASSYKVYNDTSSATLTVDNLSPGNPAGVTALPLDGGFYLSWTNPADADFSRVLVLRDTAAVTVQPVEGVSYAAGMTIGTTSTVAYSGNLQAYFDRGLTNGTTYHYRFFSLDSHGNYSVGGPVGPLVPLQNIRTVAGSPTAFIQGLDAIAVTMPYSDDANRNGTCAVEYKLSSASDWILWPNGMTRSATHCITTITGLTAGSLYDVRMTYGDIDGVLGTASQTVTGIVNLSLLQTSAGDAEAAFSAPSILSVSAPFTNDYNRNNSCLVEYKKSSDSTWTTWGTLGPADSPYTALVTGLPTLTRYDVRVTYIDPDGVNGASVQTLTGLFSPSGPNPKLMHNSLNANRKGYWAEYGGWGIPGGQYGEFTCLTCHTKRATNASGIRTNIMLSPLPGSDNFGGPVRFDGPTGPYSFGDDSVARPVPQPVNRICEVCHTLTTSTNSGPIHRNILTVTPNHAASNGKDCTSCHKHDNGFKISVQQSVPSAPFMLFPTNVTSSSVTWNFSSIGPNPTGYKLHNADNTFEIKTTTGSVKYIVETGMAANTPYTRHVHAYNVAGDSSPSGDYSVYTLSATPNVSANKATSAWYHTADFIFTNVAGFGAGGVQSYRYVWDQNPTHAFLDSETQWSTGTLPLYATANGAWYLHVKSYNLYNIGNGTLDYGPYYYDSTNTSTPTLSIGSPSATAFKGDPVTYTVTYSYANSVTLAAGNVTLNSTGNATGTIAVSGSGATSRTVTISNIGGGGTLGISIEAGTASTDTGNVAAAAGPSATFAVDSTLPSAFANAAPANNASGLLYDTVQLSGTATDNGNGPVEYFFEVATDIGFTKGVIQSGWQTSASFAPPGLPAGTTCYWHFKTRNSLLNETTYTTPWSFTTVDIFTSVNPMTTKRAYHTTTPLNNGKVLITGGHDGTLNSAFNSAELYDPSANTFTPIANPMTSARYSHTATKLNNGKVLLVGGRDSANPLGSAELYDPVANTFTATGNNMTNVRYYHTATLLTNGKVLITGGKGAGGVNFLSAELYDPDLNTFTATGDMSTKRFGQAAALLPDGKVLITGGRDTATAAFTSAELYDPSAGTFSITTGGMNAGRSFHTATPLSNGKVLITGGSNNNTNSGCLASAEIFDPGTNTFSLATPTMNSSRYHHIATLLSGGKVLITGGSSTSGYLGSAETYDLNTDTFTSTPYNMNSARYYHGAALLSSGKVLITGGMTNATTYTDSAEVYGSNP